MDVDTKTKDHFRTFSIAGCINKFSKWLEVGAEESPEYIAELVYGSATVNNRRCISKGSFAGLSLRESKNKRPPNGGLCFWLPLLDSNQRHCG